MGEYQNNVGETYQVPSLNLDCGKTFRNFFFGVEKKLKRPQRED